ncbi:MAG: hypothetical protein ACREBT_02180 [Thermoplasmata archaeon]
MSEANRGVLLSSPSPGFGEPSGGDFSEQVRLGHNVRFLLVAVGGGAVRVAAKVARRHLRHLETVAINCDSSVHGFEEFDRRIYLGPESGTPVDTGGSPLVGGVLARAAEPALSRIFDGAHFITVVGSLGGGAGSGILPQILELASRRSVHVSAFVIKPFSCEGDRRAVAERTIGRIHLLESFSDLRGHGRAMLQVLDNQSLVGPLGGRALTEVVEHWARVIGDHVEHNYIVPAESLLSTMTASSAPMSAEIDLALEQVTLPVPTPPMIPLPVAEAELTIEAITPGPARPAA